MRCDPFWLFFGRDPLCIGDDASIVPYAKPPAAAPLARRYDPVYHLRRAGGAKFCKKFKIGAQKQAGTP